MAKVTDRCRTCYHWSTNCCIYILNTGHCRPCPAGDGCTEKITRREYFKMIDNPDLSGFEPVKATRRTRTKWTTGMIEQLKTLNAEGLSDLEIADRLGVDVQAVKNKRVLSGIKKPEAQKPAPNPNPDYRPPQKKEHDPPKATIIPERPAKDYTQPMTAALVNVLAGAPVGVRVLIDGKPIEKIVARVEYDLEGKEDQRDIVLMSKDFGREIENG